MSDTVTPVPEYLDNEAMEWGFVRSDLAADGDAAKAWAENYCGSDPPAWVDGPLPMRCVEPDHPEGERWDVCPEDEAQAHFWKVGW